MAKIPDKIYVTAKKQPIKEYNQATGTCEVIDYGPNLGFMQPYNPKKPDDKKHMIQRQWAYTLGKYGCKLREVAGVWFVHRTVYENGGSYTVDEPVDPQPVILDNHPLDGFRIQKYVSRYSTSNKLWRILDPRGFELEISTASMAEIIDNSDIEKGGLIKSKCVWVSNKNLKVAT